MGVQRHSEWFQHGGVGVTESVGHRVQQRRGPGEVVAQTAVVGAVTGETNRGAQVVIAFHALFTHSARLRGVDGYTLPIKGTALDDPGDLVPEHEWMKDLSITDCPFGEPVEVGSAYTHRGHAHKALARAPGRL